MKNFFTSMLGALVALVVFFGGCFVLFIGFVAAIVAMGGREKAAPDFERGSYLVLDLSAAITDAPPVIDFRAFGADHTPTLQLRTVTRTLRAAAKDDRIAGVFIKGDALPTGYGPGYATLKEVRTALNQFKASGKPVKAYLTYATTKNYYLASAADEVAIDPYGFILMPGLASQPMFFTGFFEKYGIGVQVTRVGKWLRVLRADELPQLWNVLRGDLSLVGPRPELFSLAKRYSEEIPYYNARSLISPGLMGWAQLLHDRHPHHGADIQETRTKLAYDLYYLKNRSLLLDVFIILQTIRIILTAKGT